MTRLWSSGAELQTATAGIEFTAIITTAPVIETSTKRSGNAAYRISNAAAIEGFRQQHTGSQGLFYFRFYLYVIAFPTLTATIAGSRATGATKSAIRLTSAGVLQFFNAEDGVQIGSDSSAISLNTWYRVETNYDSTTLSATTIEARLYTDEATPTLLWNPSGSMDITTNPNSFGCFTIAGDATLDYIVDDCAINDSTSTSQNSWPGVGEIIILRPNGAGDSTAWARGGTDTGANWSQVSETPPDAGQYVQSNTSGQIDDYNMDATPAALESTDTINVVQVGIYAAVSDATASDPDVAIRASSGGTAEESASLDCNSTSFQGPAPLPADSNYKLSLYDLPGASSTAWTKTTLDSMQAGIREAVTDTHFVRVAALWVLVDHKPGEAPAASIVHPVLGNGEIQGVLFGGSVIR